jgi:rhamnogalacturonyl hydrolase YesR
MKSQLIVAVAVIIVLGGLSGTYYYMSPVQVSQQTDNQPTVQQPTVDVKEEKVGMTGLEVAKRITDYIGTQRNSEGFYTYSSNCEAPQCPFVDQVFKNANTWPVYAYVGMYRATKDSKYLESAKRDADAMLEWCAQDRNECVRVLYQVYNLYGETNDQKYFDFLKSEADALVALPDQPETNFTMLIAIDSLELSDVYVLTGDRSLLETSAKKLEQSEDLLQNEKLLFEVNGNKYYTFSCWPELARLEMFKASDDGKYLDEVKRFADGRDLPNNNHLQGWMTDAQPCIDVYLSLGELTGDASYTTGAEKMTQNVLTNFWDSKENPKVSGNDAVISNGGSDFSTVTESSYMAYLLSRMGDHVFEVS